MAEQVGCERTAGERACEEEDDETATDQRDLVAAEADPDELPVAACLDRFRRGRKIDRNP